MRAEHIDGLKDGWMQLGKASVRAAACSTGVDMA